MRCPYCKSDHTVFEQPPFTYRVCCGRCGRGPTDEFDEYDLTSGRVLEVWESWCRRKRAKMKKKEGSS